MYKIQTSLFPILNYFGRHYLFSDFSFPYAAMLISLLISIYKSLFSSQSAAFSLYSLVFSSFSFSKVQSYFFVFFFLSLCHNKSQISLLFNSQIAAPFSLNLFLTSFSFRLFPIFLSLPILSTQQISFLFRVSVNFIICNGVTVWGWGPLVFGCFWEWYCSEFFFPHQSLSL